MQSNRRSWAKTCLTAVAATVFMAAMPASADQYPSKAVRLIVSFAPGGATDVVARKLAQKFQETYKQPFIVENRPGAGGALGTTLASKAKPDGYTLFLGQVASHGVSPNLYKKLDYDPVKDFTPLGLIASSPQIIVVNPASPIKTVQDFVAFSKANSGKMTYASSGVGTTIHLAGEMFNDAVKVKMVHVPFQGSGPAVTAMLGNQATVMFDDLPSSMPHVKSGALRAIAVTGAKRTPQLPDLPTVKEVGAAYNLGNFDVSAWFALFAPAGLPDDIATSLNATLVKVLNDPEVKAFFAERGAETLPGTRAQAASFVNAELAKWKDVIVKGKIELQ
ncbi:MAG: tripartite tricarboxylate transporter substrate binding protein [Pseudomonadota bacterium]